MRYEVAHLIWSGTTFSTVSWSLLGTEKAPKDPQRAWCLKAHSHILSVAGRAGGPPVGAPGLLFGAGPRRVWWKAWPQARRGRPLVEPRRHAWLRRHVPIELARRAFGHALIHQTRRGPAPKRSPGAPTGGPPARPATLKYHRRALAHRIALWVLQERAGARSGSQPFHTELLFGSLRRGSQRRVGIGGSGRFLGGFWLTRCAGGFFLTSLFPRAR